MTDSLLNATDEYSASAGAAPDALRAEVREVVQGIAKALRAYLLYEGNSPALDRFMESLRGRMVALWEGMREVTVAVEERELLWNGLSVYSGDDGGDRSGGFRENLAFALYRDGLRELSLHRGFEREELDAFLSVLARISRVRDEQDDLLTPVSYTHLTLPTNSRV